MNKEKERKRLLKELAFYTKYNKEVIVRGENVKREFDYEIERIVERLKELGK